MRVKEKKILKSIAFNKNFSNFRLEFDTINICSDDDCNNLTFMKCAETGQVPLCEKHCKQNCSFGKDEKCELLKLKRLLKGFYSEIEDLVNNMPDNYNFESELVDSLNRNIYKFLLEILLWHYQINPKVDNRMGLFDDFKIILKNYFISNIYKNILSESRDYSFIFDFLTKLRVLTFLEFNIKKILVDRKVRINNATLANLSPKLINLFPNLLDLNECRKIEGFIFFLKALFPLTIFSNFIREEKFVSEIKYKEPDCIDKIGENKCSQLCLDFINFQCDMEQISNDILTLFYLNIYDIRYELLNIGVIHVFNETSGYGASFIQKDKLKIELENNCTKLINPILLLDKKFLRKRVLNYTYNLTGFSTQEPFLVINRFEDSKGVIKEIVLRHYYAGIYIPIDIKSFYRKGDILKDIFSSINFIQNNHPHPGISQGTAANKISEILFEDSDDNEIRNFFKKLDLSELTIRDLGGGKGEISIQISNNLVKMNDNNTLRKLTIIDMDSNIRGEIKKNFQKYIESEELKNNINSILEVKENTDFFDELNKIREPVKLSIISQVLDMYVDIKYKVEPHDYYLSQKELFNIITRTFLDELIESFNPRYNLNLSELNDFKTLLRSKLREKIRNEKRYLPDFILSPYYASIWLNYSDLDTNYDPLINNIGYERSSEFSSDLFRILKKVLELSEYVLIIDRSIEKDYLKEFFDQYKILSEKNLVIIPRLLNINVLLIYPKKVLEDDRKNN